MIQFTAPSASDRIEFKTGPNRYGVEIDLTVEQLQSALRFLDKGIYNDVRSVTVNGVTIAVYNKAVKE